jgi:hypothetical protein
MFTTEGHLIPLKYVHRIRERNSLFYFGEKNHNDQKKRKSKSKNKLNKKCNFDREKFQNSKLKRNLPMKMKYFDQLFELIGVHDNFSNNNIFRSSIEKFLK